MQHLRKLKCADCGNEPDGDGPGCSTCKSTAWIWYCDRHKLQSPISQGCEQCGILFAGSRYYSEVDLAAALKKNWNKASAMIEANRIAPWVKTGLGNSMLASRLDLVAKQGEFQTDAAITATLFLLDPCTTLCWRGRNISQADFQTSGEPTDFPDSEMALSLLASNFPEWISGHPTAQWINSVINRCRERAMILGLSELRIATPLHWWCLLAESKALEKKAEKFKALYVTSRNEKIAALLSKNGLTDLEALALITAPESDFLMPGKASEELMALLVPTLEELTLKASQRPCSQSDLQAIEDDLAGILEKIRSQREQFRSREAVSPEPVHFLTAIESVRAAVLQSRQAHTQASAELDKIKKLVERGHFKAAIDHTAAIRPKLLAFSDLNLDFLQQAAAQYRKRQRTLFTFAGITIAGFILIFLIMKLFNW